MVAGPEDVTLQGGVNRPIEMSQMHMYGVIEDDSAPNNEETETQQQTMAAQQAECPTDSENQLENCETEPIQLKNAEEERTEDESVETGLACSCESASQSNLPDVIQNDCKDSDKAKTDNAV
ncbi:hypothetical protein OS493_028470 [Desmophyllum pertusum]|uniref:Uncharacterized protein n=1 Tax=Desmophyllum pertusum TaxID=174260 RepID=A0A9W9ZKH2_9CNID|nr:hypothetical protein OS493_028470 [Desmophyllum pertusum]